MKKIGFIGLGHMGIPMVKNLIANQFQVTVYDVMENAVKEAVSYGAISGDSAAMCAKESEVVFTMLQTGAQVKSTCIGEKGVFSQLNNNGLFIDCSSIDIQTSRELHEIARSRGIAMCDAPVSGGVAGAHHKTLTFMVGGAEENFHLAMPYLNAMGKNIIYAGDSGSGVAAKICNNMMLGISMIAVCEAFGLANQLGLDPHKLFEISSRASGQCWSLTHYCPWPHILPDVPSSHDYQPGFSAKMMLKDLKLSQDAAAVSHAITPLGKQAMELYETFVAGQSSEIDFSGIMKKFLSPK